MSGDFQLLLHSPANGDAYEIGSDVTGEVLFRANGNETRYKKITVSLSGKADVYFFIPDGSENNRHFRESDTFLQIHHVLWERNDCSLEDSLPAGVNCYPFSFTLAPTNEKQLPSSIECKEGRIRYTIEAKLIRGSESEIEASVAYSRIPVFTVIEINRSDLLSPRAVEKEGAVRCSCFGQGIVSVTASLPRTGYSMTKDKIPVDIAVESENGPGLSLISVSLMKHIVCYAEGQASITENVIATETNSRLPRGGVSYSWNVPPIALPETECTLTNCDIINLNYYIRVSFSGTCMDSQNIDIPIIVGNTPFREESATCLQPTNRGEYTPTLSPTSHQYHPPAIPSPSTGNVSEYERDKENKKDDYERHFDNEPLLIK